MALQCMNHTVAEGGGLVRYREIHIWHGPVQKYPELTRHIVNVNQRIESIIEAEDEWGCLHYIDIRQDNNR